MEDDTFVIVGVNSNMQVAVFGTPDTGSPFRSEQSAERRMRILDNDSKLRDYSFAVIPMRPSGRV